MATRDGKRRGEAHRMVHKALEDGWTLSALDASAQLALMMERSGANRPAVIALIEAQIDEIDNLAEEAES